MPVTICKLQIWICKGKIVLIKVLQTSRRKKKVVYCSVSGVTHMHELSFYLVCVLIIVFTTHNSVFFLCLDIDNKHFGDKHIFLGLGKVCLFIKIICGVNQ